MPQAASCVVDKVGADKWAAQHVIGRSPQAHAALLSALFCHLRINPHEQLVEDFESELAACLRGRGIERVLEVGPGHIPFWRYLKPLAPQLQIYGFGLDLVRSEAGIIPVNGDLQRGIRTYLSQEFDLIVSIGVHCVGGFVGTQTGAFFGPFSGENILMFERTGLERETRVLFWNEPGQGEEPRVQYLVFKMEFGTEPADFVVLARQEGEQT